MRSSKKPNARQLTSTLMAIVMTATTTFQMPNIALASEAESSVAVESQIEEVTTKEASSVEVQSETVTQAAAETQTGTALETSSAAAGTDATQVSDEVQTTVAETTAEVTYEEEKTTLSAEVDPSGEDTEESEANETRGPDEELTTEIETEIETEAQTDAASEEETEASTEEALIDLSTATKDEILAYIEAIGGTESDAYYEFLGGLGEDDYQLVWIAQFGSEEDVIASTFDFDYDASSDLEIAKYVHKLTEDELYSLIESMTFEQYRRYLSIKEMMAEMDEKDFSDVIDEEEFTADRTWDYESYDAFAESLTGVSLQRTEQVMQFYNTYVDPSKVQAGVTTIDSLLDSGADWYSNDYILSLNPEMAKETVPVYHGSDGNYYVVSTVPTLNGVESADYQPATSFYNGGVEAQAFTDIEYLGNGVYRIPSSRYQYCFTEQYVSDMGTLYGISFGLRIQVLYGFTPSGEITIAADVVYPDMTERFLPAKLNLLAGIATVRVFNDDYDDSADNYLVSASINRGASLPDSVGSMNDGKVLQFVVNDANAVGSLDVLIGYNATSKYSMAAEVTTSELIGSASDDANVNMTAEMYNGAYLKLDQGSVPSNLAVGDKFIYANTGLTIVGVNTTTDRRGGVHVGASTVPTHDAQSFCLYNGLGVEPQISSWFKTQLNTNSADPGYMVQMTSYNGTSVIFGIAAVLVAGYACRLYKNPEADARKRQQVEESIARSYLEQLKKDDAAKSDGSRNVLNETESEESETKGSDSRDTCLFGTFASESLEEETMTPRWDDKNYYVRDGITYTPDYARGTLLGVLEVDYAGIRRGVYGGTWEDIQYDLDIWMTTAARPDYELGKTHFAIYGHNHTVQDLSFNRLKDVVVGDVFTYTTKDGVYIYDVTRFFADWREIVTKDYVDNFSLPADKCYIISCGRNEYRYKDIVVEGTLRCVVSIADYEKAPDYYKYSYDGGKNILCKA
jgi:sortase (surface protein transpeptidase)